MEKLVDEFTELSLGDKLGFLKQPPGFATKAIHVAQETEKWNGRPIVPPLVTSSIFEVTLPVKKCPYFYSRSANPTRECIEENLAALDNAKYGLVFSAGVAAVTAIITTLKAGDNIIASKHYYTGTIDVFYMAERFGVEVTYVDFIDLKNVENAIKENTKMVWTEPVMNPLMCCVDIKALADIVHNNSSAILVVDNTFLTPYFHRPLELGADIALYSMTKYSSGHSDIIGGSLAVNDEKLYKTLRTSQTVTGTVMSPFDCYIANRSIKTLAVRMEKHFENSYKVAKWLEKHPKIEKVLHPALPSHRGYKISLKQFYGYSGVFSFYLKGNDYEKTRKFFSSLKMMPLATSFGGVESTICFPREMSHTNRTDEECLELGVTNSLIRLSVGIEDVRDIIEDLRQALGVL